MLLCVKNMYVFSQDLNQGPEVCQIWIQSLQNKQHPILLTRKPVIARKPITPATEVAYKQQTGVNGTCLLSHHLPFKNLQLETEYVTFHTHTQMCDFMSLL